MSYEKAMKRFDPTTLEGNEARLNHGGRVRLKEEGMSMDINDLTPDWLADQRGVLNFSGAMLEKLHDKRNEGRGGWHDQYECTMKDLKQMLKEHIKKGDMVDIANFAMMIWNREQMDKP